MSDFTSNFWSVYVAGISLVGILACLVLLWFSGKAKAMTANDNTTGHVWDGDLREMNNPLPRWWVWLFIITVVFALVYLVLYPGLGKFGGTFGWSQAGQYDAEVAKGNKEVEPLYAKFNNMKPEDVAGDTQAMAIGERLFMNHCSQCHGSDAHGSKGFPNLTDHDWLYGGTPDKIVETITAWATCRPWLPQWAAPTMCAMWPITCSAFRAARMTRSRPRLARASSAPAPPAMVWMAKAIRHLARLI